MVTYGFKFESRPPLFVREREDAYCPRCYARMWPGIPPSDYHRRMLAIAPVTCVATARTTRCRQCGQRLAH